MSKFIRVRYTDRYAHTKGNYIWLNLDRIISVNEGSRGVWCGDDSFYTINEEDMPTLIDALKEGADNA